MPLYEYQCRDCQRVFERLESLRGEAEPARCRACGSPQVARIEFSRVAVGAAAEGGGAACCTPGGL